MDFRAARHGSQGKEQPAGPSDKFCSVAIGSGLRFDWHTFRATGPGVDIDERSECASYSVSGSSACSAAFGTLVDFRLNLRVKTVARIAKGATTMPINPHNSSGRTYVKSRLRSPLISVASARRPSGQTLSSSFASGGVIPFGNAADQFGASPFR
jgi:hypothetical protein